MRKPGAIVVGGHVNGLGLVRALAARGIRTAVVTTKPYDIAHHSRWIAAHDVVPDVEDDPDALAALLERWAPDWSGSVVLPANDGGLAALALHQDRLSSSYRVVAPPADVVRYFLDKEQMLDVARAVGVDVPRDYGPAVETTATSSDLRFPVVVKPNVGHRFFTRFGCKLLVAHDRGELLHCIARFRAAGMSGRVFDLVPGGDREIYAYCTYVGARGEPAAGVTIRKIRQGPPFFGVARVAEVVADDPTLREATVEIARRIGFRGIAAAEFKRDPRDGRFRFLEINGRSVIYNGLLRKAGLDVGALAWSDYACGRPEPARPHLWPGVWIHLHADVLYSTLQRRHDRVSLVDFYGPYLRPKTWAVWSATDAAPFVVEWSRTARAGASALRQGTWHDVVGDRTRPALSSPA